MQWFREALIDAHKKQRAHLFRITEGLTSDLATQKMSNEERFPDMLAILKHIGNSETYWFHKNGHDLLEPMREGTLDETIIHLKLITKQMIPIVKDCEMKELEIISPSESNPPTIAWCVLRTVQHGIYHSGQIAKMRHIGGDSTLQIDDGPWRHAIDAIPMMIARILNQDGI